VFERKLSKIGSTGLSGLSDVFVNAYPSDENKSVRRI